MPMDKQSSGQNSQQSQTSQQGRKGSDLSNQERPSQGSANAYGSNRKPDEDSTSNQNDAA